MILEYQNQTWDWHFIFPKIALWLHEFIVHLDKNPKTLAYQLLTAAFLSASLYVKMDDMTACPKYNQNVLLPLVVACSIAYKITSTL